MNETDEVKGVAILAQAMAFALLSKLEAKGVMSPQDTDEVFERVFDALEGCDSNDQSVRVARLLANGLADLIAGARPPTH